MPISRAIKGKQTFQLLAPEVNALTEVQATLAFVMRNADGPLHAQAKSAYEHIVKVRATLENEYAPPKGKQKPAAPAAQQPTLDAGNGDKPAAAQPKEAAAAK